MPEMTEDERFRIAVRKSEIAANAFAAHLRKKGLEAIVTRVKVRPHFDQREGYGDSEDIRARYPDGEWKRFEVKGRGAAFTGRGDYPYPSVMADRANKTTPPCDWYITMSKDLCYAAVMDGRQMDRWSVRIVYDSTKGYSGPVYFCPLDLAYFVRLLK